MKFRIVIFNFTFFISLFTMTESSANISVPSIFDNHMVLQQNTEVIIWGWGKPMEPVVITTGWGNETIETKADYKAT